MWISASGKFRAIRRVVYPLNVPISMTFRGNDPPEYSAGPKDRTTEEIRRRKSRSLRCEPSACLRFPERAMRGIWSNKSSPVGFRRKPRWRSLRIIIARLTFISRCPNVPRAMRRIVEWDRGIALDLPRTCDEGIDQHSASLRTRK